MANESLMVCQTLKTEARQAETDLCGRNLGCLADRPCFLQNSEHDQSLKVQVVVATGCQSSSAAA